MDLLSVFPPTTLADRVGLACKTDDHLFYLKAGATVAQCIKSSYATTPFILVMSVQFSDQHYHESKLHFSKKSLQQFSDQQPVNIILTEALLWLKVASSKPTPVRADMLTLRNLINGSFKGSVPTYSPQPAATPTTKAADQLIIFPPQFPF